jgi:hypothetical protein
LIYIFLHQERKQCLEFALPKPGEICKYLAGAYNLNSHARGLHYLTLVCGNKAGKINTTWRVVLRIMSQKSSSLSILFEVEVPLQNGIRLPCRQKTNLFCETWIEKGIGEKGESVTTSS